ncbi:MAG: hypothetical protein WC799_15035 [Desulfobacteraceae bacterium]|jgi:hypothetical protein
MIRDKNHKKIAKMIASSWLRCIFLLLLSLVLNTSFTAISHAELKAMTQGELKTATAQAGFTDFNLNSNTARLFIDIHIETVAVIDRFTAGNYSGGSDQIWSDVALGTTSNPLIIDGLVFMADFEEGSLGTNPTLERVVIGSNRLQGSISALISNFTGIYSSALTSGGSPDTILSRHDLTGNDGNEKTTFNFDSSGSITGDQGLFFILNIDSNNFGVQVVAGYNEKNIPSSSTVSPTPWWDSP